MSKMAFSDLVDNVCVRVYWKYYWNMYVYHIHGKIKNLYLTLRYWTRPITVSYSRLLIHGEWVWIESECLVSYGQTSCSTWNWCLASYFVIYSDVGDGIFRHWGSITCLLMPWLLKSPNFQQAWHWLCRTGSTYLSCRINFIYLSQAKSKILFKCDHIFSNL